MSEANINSLYELNHQLSKRIEELSSKVIEIANNLSRLPDIIDKQTASQIDALYMQNHFQGMIELEKVQSAIGKYQYQLNEQKERIKNQMDYIRDKIETLCLDYENLISMIKNKERDRVIELDSKVFEYIGKINNGELNKLINKFELPYLNRIKEEEEIVYAFRIRNIVNKLSKIEQVIEKLEGIYRKFIKGIEGLYCIKNAEGHNQIGIGFMEVEYRVGKERHTVLIEPSRLEWSGSEKKLRPLLNLSDSDLETIRPYLITIEE